MRLKSQTVGQAGLGLLFVLLLVSSAGATYVTPIGDSGETTVDEILTNYYSTWERIYDGPVPGDQWWYETDGVAFAEAKFAGDVSQFGYAQGLSGGSPGNWISVEGSGFGAHFVDVPDGPEVTLTIQGDPFFRMYVYDNTTGKTFSSLESENSNDPYRSDHMVTYKILTDSKGFDSSGNYVVFWEDRINGDYDYNDLAVEMYKVAPVPEPTTVALFGLLLAGAALTNIARARRRR